MFSSKEKEEETVVQLTPRKPASGGVGTSSNASIPSARSEKDARSGNNELLNGKENNSDSGHQNQNEDAPTSNKQESLNETKDKKMETHQVANGKKEMTSKEKGDEFEDFTVNLLADWRMKLLRRTQDKMSSNGVVAESCKEPDLHIQQKHGKSTVDYHLECKYRTRWTDNAVTFEEWQIKRYRDFQRTQKRKVLIALGVGGTPNKPQSFMIVPIDSIKDNAIQKIDVNKYSVTPTSDGLVAYIDHYLMKYSLRLRGIRNRILWHSYCRYC